MSSCTHVCSYSINESSTNMAKSLVPKIDLSRLPTHSRYVKRLDYQFSRNEYRVSVGSTPEKK